MTTTLLALLGIASWTLFLMLLIIIFRTKIVINKEAKIESFRPDNAGLSSFMQRLARAHANCLENLPIFGIIMLVAVIAGKSSITDPLAYALLVARVIQSCIHMLSISPVAIYARSTAFIAQLAIVFYWLIQLFTTTF